MADNLNFRKPHMTFFDGYFYMFDDDTDMLLQKTDDGITAFSYPFDTLLVETVKSIEYDGINFWTLHDGGEINTQVIYRWRIENYVCKLKDTINLTSPDHNFDADCFTVEHYHCTTSGVYNAGETQITVNSDNGELPGQLLAGMTVTIGPNSEGLHETFEVQHVSGDEITLADPLENNYQDGNDVLFYNYIWLFNNHHEQDDTTGALYKFNAYAGSIVDYHESGVYKDVKATTFSEISHFTAFGTVNSLMYVKASNLLFVNINDPELSYYGSMAMDTVDANEVDIIEVFDIAVSGNNVYRLQLFATYYGSTIGWQQYNYQPATFNQIVSSLAMDATPNVIAANGVSTAEITARVKDQFLQPIAGRLVYFTVSTQSDGSLAPGQEALNTDSKGEATTTYISGTEAEIVKIIARVQQS